MSSSQLKNVRPIYQTNAGAILDMRALLFRLMIATLLLVEDKFSLPFIVFGTLNFPVLLVY